MPPTSIADLLTLREIASLLGTPYSTVYSIAASGRFGLPTQVGRQLLYDRRTAEQELERRRTDPRARSHRARRATGGDR